MVDDLYVKTLEHEAERTNKILDKVAELVDEGVYTTSTKSAHKIFAEMGRLLGLHMEDVYDEFEDDEDDDDLEDLYGD